MNLLIDAKKIILNRSDDDDKIQVEVEGISQYEMEGILFQIYREKGKSNFELLMRKLLDEK